MANRIRALHGAFAAALALIAFLAVATALGTSGPWFSSTVSIQVYATSLLAAVLLSFGIAAVASSRMRQIDDAVRTIDLRVAQIPEAVGMPKGHELGADFVHMIPPSDQDVDELLTVLAMTPPEAGPQAEIEYTETLVEVSTALTAAKTRKELLKALLTQRTALEGARKHILPNVIGPLGGAFSVALAAGAMLPGVEGFASTHFQLNTAVVLFLGYAWAFLGAWVAAAVAALHARRA